MNRTDIVVAHPAPVEETPSADYTLAVNAQPVFVHQARVSAQPINQVWPGYQRPLEQTELAAFATWDMAGPVDVVVVSARPIRDVKVRPASRGVEPSQEGQTLRFTLDRPGPITVEVNGMHRALHLFANAPEADAPDPSDPTVRTFGPGVHCPGVIRMTSGQTVYLAGGAVVYGAIIAEHAENIVIRGRGILDGSKFSRGEVSALINTIDCDHVAIEDIILRDPCGWTLVPVMCRNVHIRNIKLIGLWRYNADGIDFVNSRHCSVEDSFVRAYDDCIAFKGLQAYGAFTCDQEPITEIQVRRCVLWNDWGRALEIGAETVASEVSHLLFEDCDIIHCLDVAMEVQNGDRAHCHHLLFKNIRVELDDDQTRPVYQKQEGQVYDVDASERHLAQLIVLVTCRNMWSKDSTRGRIDDIRYEDIEVTAWATPELYFAGLDAEHMVQDVSIENLRINGRRVHTQDDARFNIKPFVGPLTLG
ncbi:MAG: glycosyl hydrolase family 28 protein [Verrucomicrobia bacterium]|nr:glycosyl hydrolase family 28 protein [Verrucomicrobiota bacterium]